MAVVAVAGAARTRRHATRTLRVGHLDPEPAFTYALSLEVGLEAAKGELGVFKVLGAIRVAPVVRHEWRETCGYMGVRYD